MHYSRYYKARSERGRQMARRRWDLDRARRDAEEPARLRELAEAAALHPQPAPGDATGALEYRDFRSGEIRRWTVLRGPRADQVQLRHHDGRTSPPCGWARVLDGLRPHLVSLK